MLLYWSIFPAALLALVISAFVIVRFLYRRLIAKTVDGVTFGGLAKSIGCAFAPLITLLALILLPMAYLHLGSGPVKLLA